MIKRSRFLACVIASITILFAGSCGSQKTYTYHFSHYDYGKKTAQRAEDTSEKTTDPLPDAPLEAKNSTADEKEDTFTGNVSLNQPTAKSENVDAGTKQYLPNGMEVKAPEAYTKAERKQIKKDFKKQVKTYKRAVKSGDSVLAEEAAAASSEYLRLGVIIGVAGLLVAIIAGSGAIAAIGWIAFLVGIVLIVIHFINYG